MSYQWAFEQRSAVARTHLNTWRAGTSTIGSSRQLKTPLAAVLPNTTSALDQTDSACCAAYGAGIPAESLILGTRCDQHASTVVSSGTTDPLPNKIQPDDHSWRFPRHLRPWHRQGILPAFAPPALALPGGSSQPRGARCSPGSASGGDGPAGVDAEHHPELARNIMTAEPGSTASRLPPGGLNWTPASGSAPTLRTACGCAAPGRLSRRRGLHYSGGDLRLLHARPARPALRSGQRR